MFGFDLSLNFNEKIGFICSSIIKKTVKYIVFHWQINPRTRLTVVFCFLQLQINYE